ncbi:MAG: MBL fold metallo-hydrolase [Desulfobacterales bacterium]|nr:MBL fold metallo-hydrolase [Desulfobacterales bacterium]
MAHQDEIIFQWFGAAHHHILYKNRRIVIDPLYTRLPGDIPHLEDTEDDIDSIDYLLLTHAHLDHSMNFPSLLKKLDPEAYAPEKYLIGLKKKKPHSELRLNLSKCHFLEKVKGQVFNANEIEVTPYQIGTETIDFWFIRSMFIRPWLHRKPQVIPYGFKWLGHHLFCNCFAYHFLFPPDGKTMLYFGNLTDEVIELDHVDKVNILAIPYCPANNKWLNQSQFLINRFKPDVTMIHHFDNFMNPYTLSKYLDLSGYQKAIYDKCPEANLYFSRFCKSVHITDIIGHKK